MKYCHAYGCGDFYQCEGYMTDDERDSIEVIYHPANSRQSEALIDAIRANPRYAKVKHKALSYPTERIPGVQSFMSDHGILHRKDFRGSSFLEHDLAVIPFELPTRFDFLHLHTPMNTAGVRKTRDMKPEEWGAVLKRLEDRDTIGVVINSLVEGELPPSDRLVDLRGQTTMPVAIEILKRATGYIGIDSCFAILAAQLFGHDDILIRSRNPYVTSESHVYYAPHQEIGFLTPEFGKPRYPKASKPVREQGVLIELKCNSLVGIRNFGLDDRVEVHQDRADELISLKKAIPYTLGG